MKVCLDTRSAVNFILCDLIATILPPSPLQSELSSSSHLGLEVLAAKMAMVYTHAIRTYHTHKPIRKNAAMQIKESENIHVYVPLHAN